MKEAEYSLKIDSLQQRKQQHQRKSAVVRISDTPIQIAFNRKLVTMSFLTQFREKKPKAHFKHEHFKSETEIVSQMDEYAVLYDKNDALCLSSMWSKGDKGQKNCLAGEVTEVQKVARPFVTSKKETKCFNTDSTEFLLRFANPGNGNI